MPALCDTLGHRGPDARGVWGNDLVQLGHTRLAIIDLDAAANQPFVDNELGLVLTYNGEIYNYIELRDELRAAGYTFRTRSDTEVLLKAYHHWRDDSFQRLHGMWAFAMYDMERRELVLCRDRFGIKPLYYTVANGSLAFASEPQALLRTGLARRIADHQVVSDFLDSGLSETDDRTFFVDIRAVPAACSCRLPAAEPIESVEFRRFWSPANGLHGGSTPASYEAAVAEFRHLLADAVRIHLRSDVPIGMCLSGGIDSSVLAGMCSDRSVADSAPHPFAAIFPNTAFDESPYVSAVERKYGLRATRLEPDPQQFGADIDEVVTAQGEPFGSTGIYLQWKVYQAIAAGGYKVAFDGQGADEYLGGYLSFVKAFVAGTNFGTALRRMATSLVPIVSTNLPALRYRFGGLGDVLRAGLSGRVAPERLRVRAEPAHRAARQASLLALESNGVSPFKRMLIHYMTSHSLPSLLRFADRNSMTYSVEARVPYLDHRLVEFTLALPDEWLIRRGYTKAILRDAAADILPASVRGRRLKLGYASPQYDWTRDVILERILGSLDAPAVSRHFNVDRLRKAALHARRGGVDARAALWWRLYNVIRWQDVFSVA